MLSSIGIRLIEEESYGGIVEEILNCYWAYEKILVNNCLVKILKEFTRKI